VSLNSGCLGLLTNTLDRIMNATIRENILFSHRYDEEFYNVVLDGAFCFTVGGFDGA
jgi:hypothetical protein